MTDIKQKFYETTYKHEKSDLKPKGLLGKLYILLKRYESYRSDVIYDLLTPNQRYLDIGCGNGELVIYCLDKFEFVCGLDIARTRLQIAQKKINTQSKDFKKRIKFQIFDADTKYPFPNNYFNAVTLVATLEHFFDPYQVMSEVARIIKSGGQLIIQVPNLGFLPRRIAVLFGKLPVTSEDEYGWDGGHLHYFTIKTLVHLAEKYRFKVEKVTCSGVLAPLRRWWMSLLGSDIIISARKF